MAVFIGQGVTIFLLLNLYLFFEEGIDFYKNYKRIGWSGLIGGTGLGIAMISFIWSITITSAAVSLVMSCSNAIYDSFFRIFILT